MIITPTNNYNGHGFYQFSADLFFDVLNSNGFCIQDISYIEELGNEKYVSYRVERPIPNRKLITGKRACLQVCAKKISRTPLKLTAQQSLYQPLWGNYAKSVTSDAYLNFYDLDREINNRLGNHDDNKIFGKKFLLYGAGKVCRSIIEKNILSSDNIEIVGIADKNAKEIEIKGFVVNEIEYFKAFDFDYIVITAGDGAAAEIRDELIKIYGYNSKKIMNLEMFLYYLRPCLY